MKRRLIKTDWMVPLGVHDSIQSYLVEHPNRCYMWPHGTWLYWLDRELGLIFIDDEDLAAMNEEEIATYIFEVVERLKK